MTYLVGQKLGNYRVTRQVGQGGFADVYLGEHIYLKTPAAIKILQLRLDNEALQKFLQEARTIARLDHPHIVRVLDFGIENGTPFLAMNYAPYGSIRQRFPSHTILPTDIIISYVKQIASALQYAHNVKVIHRDVKPENMLIGQNKNILLSDFGLSIIAHSTRSQRYQSANYAGTTAYMAPEQFEGKPTRASDQYALGVVVYEWFCGTLPFSGTDREIAMQQFHAPPAPMRSKVPSIDPSIEQVVMKALEKDSQARFENIQDFANALENACRSNGALPIEGVDFSYPLLSLDMPSNISIPNTSGEKENIATPRHSQSAMFPSSPADSDQIASRFPSLTDSKVTSTNWHPPAQPEARSGFKRRTFLIGLTGVVVGGLASVGGITLLQQLLQNKKGSSNPPVSQKAQQQGSNSGSATPSTSPSATATKTQVVNNKQEIKGTTNGQPNPLGDQHISTTPTSATNQQPSPIASTPTPTPILGPLTVAITSLPPNATVGDVIQVGVHTSIGGIAVNVYIHYKGDRLMGTQATNANGDATIPSTIPKPSDDFANGASTFTVNVFAVATDSQGGKVRSKGKAITIQR